MPRVVNSENEWEEYNPILGPLSGPDGCQDQRDNAKEAAYVAHPLRVS